MVYFFRTVIIIIITIIIFKGLGFLSKKLDRKILNDLRKHFEAKSFKVVDIHKIESTKDGNIPFDINEWTFTTSGPSGGKNYYQNKFWKVMLKDENGKEIIKWANTGHFFTFQMYFIVKD